MAPPTYDASKHHIGLKAKVDSTVYGFTLAGGYRKQLQREALGAQEFGGGTDLIGMVPSTSRWTQDDFVGGMFAYNWGKDDAMFADCMGMIPGPQSRSLFSCPPMFQKKAVDPDGYSGFTQNDPIGMFMVAGSIYTLWPNVITRYQIDSDTLTDESAPTDSTYVWAAYDSIDQKIWLGCNSTVTDDRPFIRRLNTDFSDPSFDATYIGPSGSENLVHYGGTIHEHMVLMAAGRKLWLGTPPAKPNATVNGTITWTLMPGRVPGRWKDSVAYNGGVYILVNDGSFKSNILFFDGTAVMPICTLPFNFYGKTITEYAGRIYVGGSGTDVNGGEHYAELYEVTGASVRLVRSFTPETRNAFLGGLAGEWPRAFDDLVVFEGLLWMCQKGKRMIAYDVTSDAFFGASEILSNDDLNFVRMTTGRGRVWAFGVDDNADGGHGIYRIAQPADSIGSWNPTLVTSDFNYEPAVKKRWGKFRVLSRYGGCESIEYSINGGDSWTSLSVTVSSTYGKLYYSDADLAAIAPVEHIRFRIKLTDTGDAGDARTYHRELVSYTASFVMTDTGKKAWSLTIYGGLLPETRDASLPTVSEATTQTQDISDIRDTLWGWADNKTALTFKDLTQDTYDVQLVDLSEVQPVVGPNETGETEPEALYNVTLLEV